VDTKFARFRSNSPQETIELGKNIGVRLQQGDVVGLIGELGTGKTWLTKGLALGLGVQAENMVTSPSFTLVNVYEGRIPIYHMDAYRLKEASDFISAGLEEYFYMEGVAILEWADRWPEIMPSHCLYVLINFANKNSRDILVKGDHPRPAKIIGSLLNLNGNGHRY